MSRFADTQVRHWLRLQRDTGMTDRELLEEIAGLFVVLDKKLAACQRRLADADLVDRAVIAYVKERKPCKATSESTT